MEDPASFYTGLVADLYGPLRSVVQDPEPYARFIERSGQPALELGCGDGDPLLELRRRGLDVEGVDSSADMLERCRRRAADAQLDVVVHHQRIESLDLPTRYRSIFLAGPTFNLLADDATAAAGLAAIRRHLADGGAALVPLFIPEAVPESALGRVREATNDDGVRISFSVTASTMDEVERRQETMTRYERHGDQPLVVERPWILHWHTQEGFRQLAADAGLDTVAVLGADGQPADAAAANFAFVLAPTT